MNETDERVLSNFDKFESICREISHLDPLNARKIFKENKYSIRLPKLCEINHISNEIAAIRELREFTLEFERFRQLKHSFLNDESAIIATGHRSDTGVEEMGVGYELDEEGSLPVLVEMTIRKFCTQILPNRRQVRRLKKC